MRIPIKRLLSAPTLLCGVGLVALVAAGWLRSDGVKLAISVVGGGLLIWALAKIFQDVDFTSPRLLNGTTHQLAWIRIIVCLTALIYTVIEDLPLLASLPVGMQNTQKFSHLIHNLPGSSTFFASPYLLGAVQWTTAALLLLGLIGFRTRITMFLGGLGFFVVQAVLRHYSYLYHSGLVPVYLMLLLPWTSCGAVWSLDRRLNPSKPQPNPQVVGLSIFAVFAVMAAVYLMCGLSKMRDSGWSWFDAGNIEQKLVTDALEPIFLDYKWKATLSLVQHQAPPFVFIIIAAFGLVSELGYVSVLFSRKAQIILPVMAFGVHLGILVFQHILFLDLLLLQLIFLDVDRFTNFWRRRFRINLQSPAAVSHADKSRHPLSYISTGTVAAMIVIFLLGWVWRVEYYPITSWHMYAKPEPKRPVFYLKIAATLEDGRSIDIPLANFSPVVIPNVRYFLMNAFIVKRRNDIVDQYLEFFVQRRNRDLSFGSPITGIEIQRWRWNYIAEPNNPRFGWVTNVYPYDATSKPSLHP